MKHSTKARGFTLIEVLAATGIMSIVILVVLSLTTNVLSVWNRSTGKLSSNYEARVALDLMANDFETLVMRNRPFNWVQVNYAKPDAGDLSSKYDKALPLMPEMYFMARVEDRPRFKGNDEDNPDPIYGDICAVAYRVRYQNPLDSSDNTVFPMFGLYRFVIDSENTFNSVMDTSSAADGDIPDLSDQIAFSPYIDENGGTATVTDLATKIETEENFLSANVVNLRVVFWFLDENGDYKPITQEFAEDADPVNFRYTDRLLIGDDETAGTLEYVDIAITVMTPEGIAILEGNDVVDVDWNDLMSQYGSTYSRRVQIMAKPL